MRTLLCYHPAAGLMGLTAGPCAISVLSAAAAIDAWSAGKEALPFYDRLEPLHRRSVSIEGAETPAAPCQLQSTERHSPSPATLRRRPAGRPRL